ncbi:MAG: diacylglycerol O-acyltransferase / wax synthase [Chloroflexota bacterium]|jgi:WS/DGAT/MGAT family acyltransferase|nr:diacylglycerol O-acyltransferase / wax synthase [Chloroflexota bacterium]
MPERLTALDATFLNVEQPHMPMHVAGLFIFKDTPEIKGRPGVAGIFQTVEERLHLVPRYRQRVQPVPFGLGHPLWVDDPDFDLAYHLRRLALPHPGGWKELLEVVSRIHARPLDRARPLWEMYIIEGVSDGRVAVYSKSHHAMVDGLSYVDLATVLMDFDAEGWRPAGVEAFNPPRPPGGAELVGEVVREAAEAVIGGLGTLLRRPSEVSSQVVDGALRLSQARDLLGMLRPAPAGPLNVKIGGARRVDTSSVELTRVKAIKNALGGTVNDVVLTIVAEAVHVFLLHRGEAVPEGLRYRVMVPVSAREESGKSAMGNQVTAMFVDLPVGRMAPRRRLQLVSRAMAELKERRQSEASDQVMAMTAWAPAALHSLAGRLDFAGQRMVNMVVSNVPGIQVPAYAGGAQMLEAYPLLPIGGNMGVVVCVVSYNGGLYFGLVGDYDRFPDLEVMTAGLRTGIENLERASGARGPKRAAKPARRAAAAHRRAARRTARKTAARRTAARAVSARKSA